MGAQVTHKHFGIFERLLADLTNEQLEIVVITQRMLLGIVLWRRIRFQLDSIHLKVQRLLGRQLRLLAQLVVVVWQRS